MKKFILQLFFFLLLFSTIVITIGKFDNAARCYNDNANIQKLTCLSSFDSLDILFIGNSYCYSGINPAHFDSVNIRTFNLGVSGAGVNYYSALINDYLTSVRKKPKSVFLLISPLVLSSRSDDGMNNPIYRYLNDPISNENYILTKDFSAIKNYPKICIKSFSRAATGLFSFLKSKKNFCETQNNPMFYSKGFVASDKINTLKEELKSKHFYTPLLTDKFNTLKAGKLISIAEELEKKNIKVIFYELPSNKLYSFFNKDYLDSYHNFLIEIARKYPFINIKMKLDGNKYRDLDHVNSNGSSIVCKEIIRQIMSDKVLTSLYQK